MIKPADRILRGFDCRHFWQSRPAQHDDVDAQRARRSDLAVGCIAAAVLGDDAFDAMLFQQRAFVGLAERPARHEIDCVRYVERRIDRIDAADQIVVLWGGRKCADLLAADRKEGAALRIAKRTNGIADILSLGPSVASDRRPGRPPQGDDRDLCNGRGCRRMGRDGRGIGMGGIDQHVDTLGGEIGRQPLDAAEAADTHRDRLGGGLGRAARQRKRYVEIGSVREEPGQLPRLARAAEDENIPHAVR